mmetsp:Transcript_1872/g.1579  ORF Transcript_1872/g.1579 Transcript_1872/m.1579 type:complete len:233 (+) Transcript_1872:69-767(+)
MSNDDYSFMGGNIVSYKQQQKIDQDLKAFEMSLQNKKKKGKTKNNLKQQQSIAESRNIAYTQLLSRIFNELKPTTSGISIDGKLKPISIPKPDVRLAGAKKTCFVNIINTCQYLQRDPNHLKKFIETELVTNSNFNGDFQLIITGRFGDSHIQSVLKSYVKSYVLCEDCHSKHTQMKRNNSTRLYELKCKDCSAERTCKRIEKAFVTIANKKQKIEAIKEREKEKRSKRNNK